MFSKLFGSKKDSRTPRQIDRPQLSRVQGSHKSSEHTMQDAQRETYSTDKPTQELGISDLVKSHNPGDRFLYAAVVADTSMEDSSRMRRLMKMSPRLGRKQIPIDKLPAIPLFEETETFSLSSLLPKQSKNPKGINDNKPKYIHIVEVICIYGSVISSDSLYTKARLSIFDDRLLGNKIAKTLIVNTNVMSFGEMNLSYCFPRAEVDDIKLSISREAAFLEEGKQWGVVQIELKIEELDFPVQTTNMNVIGTNALPLSLLEDRTVDPDCFDISFTNNNRKDFRNMYLDGDITNEVDPIVDKVEQVRYAKSSIRGPRGKKAIPQVAEEWNFMNDHRQRGVDAGMASMEPSEDGVSIEEIPRPATPPLKSAMKKKTTFAETISPVSSTLGRSSSDTSSNERRKIHVENPSSLGEFLK